MPGIKDWKLIAIVLAKAAPTESEGRFPFCMPRVWAVFHRTVNTSAPMALWIADRTCTRGVWDLGLKKKVAKERACDALFEEKKESGSAGN